MAVICPNCGAQTPTGTHYCQACGHSLHDKKITCAFCGAQVSESDKQCPLCGKALHIKTKKCEYCGTTMEANEMVCPKCWKIQSSLSSSQGSSSTYSRTSSAPNSVPNRFEDCYKQDSLSARLSAWGKNLEIIGKIVFWIIIVFGIVNAIATASSTYGAVFSSDTAVLSLFIQLGETAVYAILEYWAYRASALLISALASIVQSNKITANVALYRAKKDLEDK